ncbi:hypothetical protein NFI96_005600, partial [Prochilodus magdalenae]
MKPLPGDSFGRWRVGTCLRRVAPRSYLVDVDGSTYRRNRVDLRVAKPSAHSPSRTQHFTNDSLSLSCEGQSNSTGWRVRRYTHNKKESDCSSGWGSATGSTCNISSLSTSHTGVYWCESESGGSSNANITVHSGSVILESPVDPVPEGDPLTLHCLYHHTNSSNLTAEFYKDGSLLQTQTTGEMTIRTVSKSDEGLYHCKHLERGESPQSWISVTERPKPELTSSHKGAALIGSPVVLNCKLDQSAGWKFYWSKHTQNPENETKTETPSYTISSVSVSDGGQYWCRAGRGDPVYYSHYSDALWINTTGISGVSDSGSPFPVLSSLMAVSPYLLVSIILAVKYYRAR